jgi:hypothetical protein
VRSGGHAVGQLYLWCAVRGARAALSPHCRHCDVPRASSPACACPAVCALRAQRVIEQAAALEEAERLERACDEESGALATALERAQSELEAVEERAASS